MPFVPDPKRIEVVDEAVAAILRTKTPAERIALAFDAFETRRRPVRSSQAAARQRRSRLLEE